MMDKRNKTVLYPVLAAFVLNLIESRKPTWFSWGLLVLQNDTLFGLTVEDEPLNQEIDY